MTLVRLLGNDRKEIENIAKNDWSKIIMPKNELGIIAELLVEITVKSDNLYVNVNNHYEGSAPLTIERLKKLQSEINVLGRKIKE